MAQVASRSVDAEEVGHALDWCLREWSKIPEVARCWRSWSEDDRLDYVVEWPLKEDNLSRLREWSDSGLLTADQEGRYREVEALVSEHRPLVEHLLAQG